MTTVSQHTGPSEGVTTANIDCKNPVIEHFTLQWRNLQCNQCFIFITCELYLATSSLPDQPTRTVRSAGLAILASFRLVFSMVSILCPRAWHFYSDLSSKFIIEYSPESRFCSSPIGTHYQNNSSSVYRKYIRRMCFFRVTRQISLFSEMLTLNGLWQFFLQVPRWCMLTFAQFEVKPQDKNPLPLTNQPIGLQACTRMWTGSYCVHDHALQNVRYQICQCGFLAM